MQFINEIKSGKRHINKKIVKAVEIVTWLAWLFILIRCGLFLVGIDL